jgi:adenylate cyclase class 2
MARRTRKRNREVEVKLPVGDLPALLRKLRQLRAKRTRSVFEQNTLFDTLNRGFSHQDAILRIRTVVPAPPPGAPRHNAVAKRPREGTLTFKGILPGAPGVRARYKIREELEFRLRDAARFARLLRRLGLAPWFRYEKYRTRFLWPPHPGLHLDLDETPIGAFLELEGPPRAIDVAARALGFGPRQYITASYWELYLADCRRRGAKPAHMVFKTKKSFI